MFADLWILFKAEYEIKNLKAQSISEKDDLSLSPLILVAWGLCNQKKCWWWWCDWRKIIFQISCCLLPVSSQYIPRWYILIELPRISSKSSYLWYCVLHWAMQGSGYKGRSGWYIFWTFSKGIAHTPKREYRWKPDRRPSSRFNDNEDEFAHYCRSQFVHDDQHVNITDYRPQSVQE